MISDNDLNHHSYTCTISAVWDSRCQQLHYWCLLQNYRMFIIWKRLGGYSSCWLVVNINVLLYPSFNIFLFFTYMVKLWSTIINLFNADGLLCTVYIALLTSKWTLFAPLFYSFSLFSSCPFVLLSFLPRLLNYWLVWRLWRWGSVDGLGQCWVVLSCWRECRPVLHINPFNGSASSDISQWFMSHCF